MLTLTNLPLMPIAVGDDSLTAIAVSGVDFYVYCVNGGAWSEPLPSTQAIAILVPPGGLLLEVATAPGVSPVATYLSREVWETAALGIYLDEACTVEAEAPGSGVLYGNLHIPAAHLDIPGPLFIKVTGNNLQFKNASLTASGLRFTPAEIADLPIGVTRVDVERVTLPTSASKLPSSIAFTCEQWIPDGIKALHVSPAALSLNPGETAYINIEGDPGSTVTVNGVLYTSPCTASIAGLSIGSHTIKLWSPDNLDLTEVQVTVLDLPKSIVTFEGNNIIGVAESVKVNGVVVIPPCAIPAPDDKRYSYDRVVHTVLTDVVGHAEIVNGETDILYPSDPPSNLLSATLGYDNYAYSFHTVFLYETLDGHKTWSPVDNTMWQPDYAVKLRDMWVVLTNTVSGPLVRHTFDFMSWWDAPQFRSGGNPSLINLTDAVVVIQVQLAYRNAYYLTDMAWAPFTLPSFLIPYCGLKVGTRYLLAGSHNDAPSVYNSETLDQGYVSAQTLPLSSRSWVDQLVALENGHVYGVIMGLRGQSTDVETKTLIKSTNGGINWVSVSLPTTELGKMYATLDTVFFAVPFGSVYDITNNKVATSLNNINVIGTSDTHLIGKQENFLYRLLNGVVGWEKIVQ